MTPPKQKHVSEKNVLGIFLDILAEFLFLLLHSVSWDFTRVVILGVLHWSLRMRVKEYYQANNFDSENPRVFGPHFENYCFTQILAFYIYISLFIPVRIPMCYFYYICRYEIQ